MRVGRGTGAALVALAMTLLVPVVAATAGHPVPPIHTPGPTPGDLVASGSTVLSAHVRGIDVAEAVWILDGQIVPGGVTGPVEPGWGQRVSVTTDVAAGWHDVDLSVSDGDTTLTRSWSFTATDRDVTRLSGTGRVETAVEISRARFADGDASAVVLARADEIERLGYEIARHSGDDRYATAAAIARRLPPSAVVMVASGLTFPDALAVSVPAARDGTPVLLTRTDDLPEPARRFLQDRDAAHAFVIGGSATVSEGVAGQVDDLVDVVERVSGTTRFETAVEVARRFFDGVSDVSLASGVSFPDALTGTGDAAGRGQPLLLVSDVLDGATDAHVRGTRAGSFTVYGGPNTVSDAVVAAAVRAAEDGAGAPHLVTVTPSGGTVPFLDTVQIQLDRPVAAGTTIHLEIAGREVVGQTTVDGATVTFTPSDHEPFDLHDVVHNGRVVVAAVDGDGRVGRHQAGFDYLVPAPLFATVGGVDLYLPSRDVEMIGFHESNHDGARQMAPYDTATTMLTLPSRSRGTGSRTSADIVASPNEVITAPVTGTVTRAGTYRLYCDHYDHYVVIEPDAHPGWEVKMLHFVGLQVSAGQRVVAHETIVGTEPRTLPFESQVDEYSRPRNWPHVHVEVVDPSIPDRPGSGC